jgi:hypothetical protein
LDEDGPPWRFSGIAIAAGDILRMDDGTAVLFTEDELRKAAETQAGEPLSVDHPEDDDGRPQYPPPTEETVGKVPRAGWVSEASGVGYEATTHDEDVATGVQAGSFDVSVHPTFELGERDPETGAYIATNIRFRDLSVVSKGDSPSNTAEWGPNQALASLTADAIGEELTAPDGDGDSDVSDGTIRSAVRATLDAVGLSLGDVDVDAEDIAAETMGAESPVEDDNSSATDMDNDTREQYVAFLTANAGFEEESVSDMDDDVLERTYELAAEGAADDASADGGRTDNDPSDHDADADGDGDDDEQTLAEMTPSEAASELGDQLEEQGFVTMENVDEVADELMAQQSKSEQVDEIIANSTDYDEDDREDLLASADKVVDREHDRVTGSNGAQLPGSAGLTASAGQGLPSDADDDLDLEAYETGVADD